MEKQPNPNKQTGKTNIIPWLIIAVTVLIGLAVAVYFVFVKTAGQGNVNVVKNVNTAVSNANTISNINKNANIVANANAEVNTNTKVDTSDWQTYRSETYGYQFKYPRGWTPSQDIENSSTKGRIVIIKSTDGTILTFTLDVPLPEVCASAEACAKFSGADSAPSKESSGLQPATVAGREALKELKKFSVNTTGIRYLYYLYDAGNFYGFRLGKSAPYLETDIKSWLDNIVLSFEFTKEDRRFNNDIKIDTSDWKTYNNEHYGYSIKYPNGFKLGTYSDPAAMDLLGYGIWGSFIEMHIDVITPDDCSSLNECVQKHRVNLESGDKTSGLSEVTLADQSSLTEKIVGLLVIDNIFYLYNKGNLYIIKTISNPLDGALEKPMYDKIIPTFQFTK